MVLATTKMDTAFNLVLLKELVPVASTDCRPLALMLCKTVRVKCEPPRVPQEHGLQETEKSNFSSPHDFRFLTLPC